MSSTILVVYHDEIYLERVRTALLPVGYDVRAAATSAVAVEELRRERPRVVVLCPCVTAETRDAVTAAAKELHPGLTVLRLSPNHVDKISEMLQ